MTIKNVAIFTICSNNYVPMAKTLLQSAKRQHPEAKLYICLADKIVPGEKFYPSDCMIIPAEDLAIPDFRKFAFRYDVMEFNTAIKPFMFLDLIGRGHDTVLYFDPDIEIFTRLDAILEKLDGGASFVLTPHLLAPAEGSSEPDDVGIMRAGIYNLGFLGVGATTETPAILNWWARRLRYQCVNEQQQGLFVDQKFMDLVPGFASAACIMRDPRFNVAYWNLAQRSLAKDQTGWLVDGKPLGFFHFSGIDPANLTRLSKHSSAFRGDAIAAPLQALMQHYAEQVLANGFRDLRSYPYSYGHFISGNPIPAQARRLFRTQYEDLDGDPFATFEPVLQRVETSQMTQTSAEELNRHLEDIYASTSWRITRPLRMIKQLFKQQRSMN
ncbi:hypothetical protein [Belnapia sp. F-4-1]|uniref:hypothetical protein n=1 Tax=Belnapia sp. F-4-1 TaxID=1545443 RepID=UPI001186E98C|nr:hypothetical protein [Belnapia sp. F-4-1]